MQRLVGVIAEYNPFHNGHAYHLAQAKARSGCTHAAVAMSGSFVQRGEVASFDKFTRARWALQNGADIVFELPTAFAVASAERFAHGGVGVLAASGLVDALAFGAEHASLTLLSSFAEAACTETEAVSAEIAQQLKRGLSFPAARAAAYAALYPEGTAEPVLSSPNDILAIEYLKAIRTLPGAGDIAPIAVERIGAGHDETALRGDYASASALRTAMEACEARTLFAALPGDVYAEVMDAIASLAAPKTMPRLSDALLYALRRMTRDELAALPDVSEGLENTLYAQARACTDAARFFDAVKTRRYTLARLRRIAACALLGIDAAFHDRHPAPRYLRVLGVRRDAMELLSDLSREASLPVVTSRADYDALDAPAKEQFDLDLFAGELLAMASLAPAPAESEFARALLVV